MIKPIGSDPIAKLVGSGIVSSIVLLGASTSLAQLRPIADETLGDERTIVTPLDPDFPVDRIDGGARRGNNLFHSFQDFQVDAGRGVYFTDPGVDNILGRVTGGVPSRILGTLGVLGGDANLFLINPNGIIFGENARLDVGGSFVATTANAIGFGNQGFFDVTDPNAPPLLTVQPSAFLFNQVNPGAIENQSRAFLGDDGLGNDVLGLQVPNGQNLVFLGGTVVNRGNLNAFGGRVELGSVGGLGTVRSSTDGSLSFPSEIARADVRMTDGSQIAVASNNGGNIGINARNIDIAGRSFLRAGIFPGLGTVDSQAGDVVLNGTDEIRVRQSSLIFNNVGGNGIGSSGNVHITAGSLFVTEGASLQTFIFGQGKAGSVIINANDRVVFDAAAAFSTVGLVNFNGEAVGNGGDIRIYTGSLEVRRGAQLQASIFGRGDAGNVIIRASDRVVFANGAAITGVGGNGEGTGGDITIDANTLIVRNGARLFANSTGRIDAGDVIIRASDRVVFANGAAITRVEENSEGTGGDINIDTNTLVVRNGAALIASTFGQGDAGDVIIRASDRVVFDDSRVFSTVGGIDFVGEAVGDGGDINIDTNALVVRNGAQLIAGTNGIGDAGDVIIHASDRVVFDNGNAFSNVEEYGIGNGGDINIDTNALVVRNSAQLVANTSGRGNAGDVIIHADDRVVFDGTSADGEFLSAAITRVEEDGEGTGGDINIDTNALVVRNGAQLTANTRGRGRAGDVIIRADDRVVVDAGDVFSTVELVNFDSEVIRDGGNINIDTNALVVRGGSRLQASTFGRGRAGNVIIRADDRVVFDNSFAFSNLEEDGVGNGGDINIDTNALVVRNGAQLIASTRGQGDAGNVIIRADDRVVFDNSFAFSNLEEDGVGNGGNINIDTNTLVVRNGAQLIASTRGQGDAGDVVIRADDRVVFDNSFAFSAVEPVNFDSEVIRDGGNINIDTNTLVVRNGAQLIASTNGTGDAGDVVIRADDRVVFDNAAAFGSVAENGIGAGGDINIDTNALVVRNGAQLRTDSIGRGDAGNMNITARSIQLNQGRLIAETRTGDGGNITLGNVNLLQLRNGSLISTTAGTARAGGNGGNIAIDSDFIVAVPNENSDITANAFSGSGGNVTITTQGLFGIEPRDRLTDRSDITASSELGVQGTIAINTPDIDPSRGLTELPDAPVDASNQIAQACPTNGNTAEALGEFVVTGRGGLPANPTELLSGDIVLPRLSGAPNEGTEAQVGGGANPEVDQRDTVNPPPPPTVEAQGWQIDTEGNVALVAATPSQASALSEVQCQSSN